MAANHRLLCLGSPSWGAVLGALPISGGTWEPEETLGLDSRWHSIPPTKNCGWPLFQEPWWVPTHTLALLTHLWAHCHLRPGRGDLWDPAPLIVGSSLSSIWPYPTSVCDSLRYSSQVMFRSRAR